MDKNLAEHLWAIEEFLNKQNKRYMLMSDKDEKVREKRKRLFEMQDSYLKIERGIQMLLENGNK